MALFLGPPERRNANRPRVVARQLVRQEVGGRIGIELEPDGKVIRQLVLAPVVLEVRLEVLEEIEILASSVDGLHLLFVDGLLTELVDMVEAIEDACLSSELIRRHLWSLK